MLKKKDLHDIADEMYEALNPFEKGTTKQKLAGGTGIILDCTRDTWRLSIGREDKAPDDSEIKIFRRYFNVPEGVRAQHEPGKVNGWYVIRWAWPRGKQSSFLEAELTPLQEVGA